MSQLLWLALHLPRPIFVGPSTYSTVKQNDLPQLKYALLGGLGLLALIQRE
jgi:hypothetical protein